MDSSFWPLRRPRRAIRSRPSIRRLPPRRSGHASAWSSAAAARAARRTSAFSKCSRNCACRSTALPAPAWAHWWPALRRRADAGDDARETGQSRLGRPLPGFPGLSEQAFARRSLDKRFLPASETGSRRRRPALSDRDRHRAEDQAVLQQADRRLISATRDQSLPLPLSIIATDIVHGERVVFREGSLSTAMRASMSVPGLMSPVEINGEKLVDGGLVDNVPIDEARSAARPTSSSPSMSARRCSRPTKSAACSASRRRW
jgi:hypothetical protein